MSCLRQSLAPATGAHGVHRRGARKRAAAMTMLFASVLVALVALSLTWAASDCARAAGKRPVVSKLSPAAGTTAGGTVVTVKGRGFMRGGRSIVKRVRFGRRAGARVRVRSARVLTVVSPAGKGTVAVTVVTSAGSSAKAPAAVYSYRAATAYRVTASSYAPAAGNSVTISARLVDAKGRGVAQRGVKVAWSKTGTGGSFSTPTSATNARGVATVGFTTAGVAGTAYLVRATDGRARTGVSAPIITAGNGDVAVTGVSPARGPTLGGNTVVIMGHGFTGAAAVGFGGNAATDLSVLSDSRISVTAPAGSAGEVDVIVTTPAGAAVTASADRYVYALWALRGLVKGKDADGASRCLRNATVTARLDAADPLFNATDAAANLVGTAVSDADGLYTLDTSRFRAAPLPIGAILDVTASCAGQLSVMQYGVYDRPTVAVDYRSFRSAGYGDRTLPYDDGATVPQPPFEYLLPNCLTVP